MVVDRADAENLAAEFERAYSEATVLQHICEHRVCDGDEGLDYFQIGRRAVVPTATIDERRYRYFADGIAEEVAEGEKNHIAAGIGVLADEGEVPSVETRPDAFVEAAVEHVEEATHILLPRTDAYDEVFEGWKDDGSIKKLGDYDYLKTDDADCWVTRYDGDDAYVLDGDRTEVVQKEGDDAKRPQGFAYVGEYEEINDGNRLTVYLGDEVHDGDDTYDGYVDLLYRIVLSEPVIEDGGACRIRLR